MKQNVSESGQERTSTEEPRASEASETAVDFETISLDALIAHYERLSSPDVRWTSNADAEAEYAGVKAVVTRAAPPGFAPPSTGRAWARHGQTITDLDVARGDAWFRQNLPGFRKVLLEYIKFMAGAYTRFLEQQRLSLCPHGLKPDVCDECLTTAYRKATGRWGT
jgi:hypothetical protein